MAIFISRPAPDEYAESYGTYIRQVPEGDLIERLESQLAETVDLLSGLSEERALYRYADGKWSIKEVVGHLADSERIFGYRALRIARGDSTPLPGFAEDDYVANAAFDSIPLPELLEDLRVVRRGTVRLLASMKPEWLERSGVSNGRNLSVRAVAYIVAGHELHHRQGLQTRYGL